MFGFTSLTLWGLSIWNNKPAHFVQHSKIDMDEGQYLFLKHCKFFISQWKNTE